jgi:hypothetical protein
MINAALIVGIISVAIAFFSLYHLKETYGKDLNFIENI